MSNRSIKERIEKSVDDFKAEKINIKMLKDSIELNGRALEMMPYSMIKEIDEIEYKLTVSQFADEEDCYPNIEEVLKLIEAWLKKVPVEGNE
jgi:hypothetical protein